MARPKKFESATEYKNRWVAENCDRISLTVAKGKKALIADRAKETGNSINAYINNLIETDLTREQP